MPRSSRRREPPAPKVEHDVLRRTAGACRRVYRRYPNVIDVTWGLKLRGGRRVRGVECIQFFVRRKPRRERALGRARLPRFVYARRPDGALDRELRIPTDVIELGAVELACAGGTRIKVGLERGTLTLVFKNRAEPERPRYLLTCAHVAGDVADASATRPVESDCCGDEVGPVAQPVVHSTHRSRKLEYDIALAKLVDGCRPAELRVARTNRVLTGFMPAQEIRAGIDLACALPVSGVTSVQVISNRAEVRVELDGSWYQVRNLFMVRPAPEEGDSGGLLYDGTRAAGIMVARSKKGFGFFQPLEEAFRHLDGIAPVRLRCFGP
jgi:hypothetical protein